MFTVGENPPKVSQPNQNCQQNSKVSYFWIVFKCEQLLDYFSNVS